MRVEHFNGMFQKKKWENWYNNSSKQEDIIDIKVLIVLFIIAMIGSMFKIELVFGITFDLTSVFFMLIFLMFGQKKTIIVIAITGVFNIFLLGEKYIFLIHIIEIITINILSKKYQKLSVIIAGVIFWGLIGIPVLTIMYLVASNTEFNGYYLFDMIFIVINCIFNIYIAEVTYIYIIKKCILKKNISITFRHIILHIITAAILIPFMLNIFTDILKTNEYISNNVYTYSSDTFNHISDEVRTWGGEKIVNLQLLGIVESLKLEDFIKEYSKNKDFNISVINNTGIEILTVKNYDRGIGDFSDYENIEVYNGDLSKMVPVSNSKIIETNWMDGFFLFKKEIEGTGLLVNIEVPISTYKDSILQEYSSQFEFLMLFVFFIGFIVMVLNKVIFNDLTKLAINTENYKSFLNDENISEWPFTDILEIRYLVDNIKKMINELKQSFKELKNSEEMLYELAYYDTLTNLPNRLFFRKTLDELVEKLDNSKKAGIIFLDLNRFKVINDSLGHDTGDKLLKEVARRLNTLKNEKIEVFRLGGDEFVILAKVDSKSEIEEIGAKILLKFEENYILDDLVLSISCSVGASIYPDDSKNINSILQYADISMYKAKDSESGRIQLFDSEIREFVLEKLVIEKEIFNALEKGEFTLYYQPKYSSETEEIASLEALIRWSSEKLGVVSPDKFISIAEESDLIFKIDKWVIVNVCKQNKKLQDAGYEKIPIAVNISAKHFATEEIEKIIIDALEISGLEAKYLIVEITEGVLIENFQIVEKIIRNLNKIGVSISIDDFGTGYSSFNQLMKLPINEVKIDRAFVQNINKEPRKASIVKSMIELAHKLDLNVVAEGVETIEEKEFLQKFKCDQLQGYLFKRPIAIDELKKFIDKRGK